MNILIVPIKQVDLAQNTRTQEMTLRLAFRFSSSLLVKGFEVGY